MSRNPSGTYSLPEAAFVPNTTILSSAFNSNFDDIANALTDSLSRTGEGGMQAELSLDSDGFSYVVDPDTGMSRSAANTQVITAGGTDVVTVSTTGLAVTGTISASGAISGLGATPIGLGPLPWPTATAPTGWLLCYGQSLLRASYPGLFAVIGTTFGAADGTHFSMPEMRGNIPIGNTAMGGGSPTTNLTSTYFGANPAVIATVGGSQSNTLDVTGIPSITPAGSVATTVLDSKFGVIGGPGTGATQYLSQGGSGLGITATSTFTGTPFGGGLPHANVQPGIILNYIMYAGV